ESARYRPRVNQLAACQVLELLGRRAAAEDFVPVRMAAEAPDLVAVGASLSGGELEPPAARLELLGERDGALDVSQVLGVTEGQHEEGLLPRRRERGVVAGVDAFERERDRVRVLRVGARGPAVDRTRELIEDEDEGEPRSRLAGPRIELAALRALEERPEPLDDRCIRAAAKPPLGLPRQSFPVLAHAARKPEVEDLLGFVALHGLHAAGDQPAARALDGRRGRQRRTLALYAR